MRRNYILITILLCAFFLFFTFEKEKLKPKTKPNIAGVILSFDDAYINEWFATDRELRKYSWKGTFFVCKINTLSLSEIKKLLKLQKEGNEIGGHGLNHYNANTFLCDHTIDEYLDQEINPMLDLMSFYGLKVTSFAYPYGGRTKSLDTTLLKKFKIIRGRAFCEKDASKQGCYFNKTGTVFSFSVDDTHNHFSIPHLLKLLDYAKKNNKILILNSHNIVKNVTGDYQTKKATLELICQYIERNNMKFYTLSDLDNLN
ncbi:polysaccharide deacetylase family protein [Flavobacterium sp. WC2509]|uniref:polysaccharide deacetylase family protein n=1 Tax=Flavobacterium sp. WC2509 TaxID=3461406 RepID=UPI0040442438